MTRKNAIVGISGAVAILIVFAAIAFLSNPGEPRNALFIIKDVWYWALILAAGFGLQLSLYSYINTARKVGGEIAAEVAANGVITTGSMVACCAHNITALLPFLGISAAALFLVRFQLPLILVGVFSNLLGLTIMFSVIKKHSIYREGTTMERLARGNWKLLRLIVVVVGITVTTVISVPVIRAEKVSSSSPTESGVKIEPRTLLESPEKQKDDGNMVAITVKPESIIAGRPVVFDVVFNTHVIDLDFDVEKISVLLDDLGNGYKLTTWEGDPPGGHHREVKLRFEGLSPGASSMTLTFRGVAGADRNFVWKL